MAPTTAAAAGQWQAKPVVVEAVQWNGDFTAFPLEWRSSGFLKIDGQGRLLIHTLDAVTKPRIGDYVVRGTAGEYYSVKAPIFLGKYQQVAS